MLNDLNIYQKVYDLILYVMPTLQKMPKMYRFTIVMQLENSLRGHVSTTPQTIHRTSL